MGDLLSRSLGVISSGVMTFSKARSSWPAVAPTHLVRGRGAHVWDPDGNEYTDLACALGAVTLGYQDPDVEAAVADQLADGPLFSLEHPITVEVAERLTALFPCSKDGQAKFFKTGSEATTAAVRVARAYAGREDVLSAGYHGWHDWCCPNSVGIPEGVRATFIDDPMEALSSSYPERVAALVIEPEAASATDLHALRSWCEEHEVVLIFDEILTGFRTCSGGHQFLTGITPDLTTVSKAMGNGYSVAALIGKRDVMRTFEKVGVSGTFNGESIGLAAAGAVIAKTETTDYYERLWDVGGRMREGFCRSAADVGVPVEAAGMGTHWIPRFAADAADVDPIIRDKRARLPWRTLWRQEMLKRGFLIGPAYVFASYALSDFDVERFLEANHAAFDVLASPDDPSQLLVGEAAGSGLRAA